MNRTLKPAQAVLLPDYLSNSVYCDDTRQLKRFQYIDNSTSLAFRQPHVTVTAAVLLSIDIVDTTLSLNRLTTTNYNNNRTVWPALAGATPADGACLSGTMTVTPAAL